MDIVTEQITFKSKGHTDILDITPSVQEVITKNKFDEGQTTLFAVGSTTGLSTIEYEPGLVNTDIAEALDKIAPYGKAYAHNNTWNDDNGASHIRSTLTGSSLVVPFKDGQLILGTWQQICFIDYDTRPRSRTVIVQIMGKKK